MAVSTGRSGRRRCPRRRRTRTSEAQKPATSPSTASAITASSPDEKDPLFAPAGDKVYRHPTFYAVPDDVPHM
ncbi:MAG: hypothetical protein ACPF9W_00400 [Nocardioides sp.]